MEIEHTIEEDENLRRFRVEYIEKIKTSRIFCPKCNEFPLMCISQKKIAHIQFNCLKCNNEWSDNVLHFFQVDWIDETTKNEFIQRGRDMNDPETLNDLEQDRMVIIINCLKTWLNLIKSKKIFEIFNLCFKSHCDNHSDMKLSFYCKDCNVHFCNKCIEHKQHNIVTLTNIIYDCTINEKVDIFEDLKQLRLQNNSDIYKKMDTLLEKKMNVINNNKYSHNYKELIDTLTHERIALAKDFKYTCIVNDCLGAFFQLQYAIYQYKENCNNYFVLTNLKECSHFYIDNYQFPDDLNENNDIDIIIERRKAISDYLLIHFLLTYKDVNNTLQIYTKMRGLHQISIKQINISDIRKYGNHTVKINHVLLLQDGNIAVASSRPTIKIFNPKTFKTVNKFKGHKSAVNYLCCIGKEHFLSCSDDGKILKWEVKSAFLTFEFALKLSNAFNEINQICKHRSKIFQILPENEKIFISLSADRTIKFWEDKRPPSIIGTMTEPTSIFIGMILLNDCRLVTASEDNVLRFWDTNSFEQIENQRIEKVECFCADSMKILNEKILIVAGEKKLSIIDVYRNIVIDVIENNNINKIGTLLILTNCNFLFAEEEFIYVYDFTINKSKEVYKTKNTHKDIISSMLLLDNKEFITASYDSTLIRWNYILNN